MYFSAAPHSANGSGAISFAPPGGADVNRDGECANIFARGFFKACQLAGFHCLRECVCHHVSGGLASSLPARIGGGAVWRGGSARAKSLGREASGPCPYAAGRCTSHAPFASLGYDERTLPV